MGKWLTQLQKIPETPGDDTDKTDKTPTIEVSSVLSVLPRAVFDNFSQDGNEAVLGSVSFVSSRHGHIDNFSGTSGDRSGWDDDDWQAAFDERSAILEFDDCLTRADAERQACAEIAEQRKGWMQ